VATTNRAFETTLWSVAPGTALSDPVDRFEISTADGAADLSELLVDVGRRTVRVETRGGDYHARVLPPTDEERGYVLFIDAGAVDDAGDHRDGEQDHHDEDSEDPEAELGIDRAASVLSHDLRNPLDVAKARLRAGRERDEDEHFEHVAAAHDRMERIIEDVLTLSRGEEVIDPEGAVDLDAVAESAWGTVDTGDATLTVADDLPTTVADEDRAERLFENLFRNAVEHGSGPDPSHDRGDDPEPASAPEVVVGRLENPHQGFYVADDGSGIPPDERSAVFEPGDTTHDHGTGLGLSIVQRIAEAHGWSVAAVDADNGGARIEIRGVGTEGDGRTSDSSGHRSGCSRSPRTGP